MLRTSRLSANARAPVSPYSAASSASHSRVQSSLDGGPAPAVHWDVALSEVPLFPPGVVILTAAQSSCPAA